MKINQLDHYNFETADPEATLHFYTGLLGLTNAPEMRPPSSGPGTWILIGDRPAIHINFREKTSSDNQWGDTGVLDHIAFDASGYHEFEEVFSANNIEYYKQVRPEINLVQLFLHDPNGIRIEINIRNELSGL